METIAIKSAGDEGDNSTVQNGKTHRAEKAELELGNGHLVCENVRQLYGIFFSHGTFLLLW